MASAPGVSATHTTNSSDIVPGNDKSTDDVVEAESSAKTDTNELVSNKSELTTEKVVVSESEKQNIAIKNKKETQPVSTCQQECSTSRSSNNSEAKCTSNIKYTHIEPKLNAHDTSLPFSSETFTVTSDSQIWLECCQYNNTFRAHGGHFRNFHPNTQKLNSNQIPSSNHHYSSQGTSSQIHRGSNANSMNYNRNSQYVVHLHVNPGETISFDMGDHVQLIQGN